MTRDEIPFEQTCGGRFAEFRTGSGWWRVRQDGDGWAVTRFDTDQQHVSGPDTVTDKQLATLLAKEKAA